MESSLTSKKSDVTESKWLETNSKFHETESLTPVQLSRLENDEKTSISQSHLLLSFGKSQTLKLSQGPNASTTLPRSSSASRSAENTSINSSTKIQPYEEGISHTKFNDFTSKSIRSGATANSSRTIQTVVQTILPSTRSKSATLSSQVASLHELESSKGISEKLTDLAPMKTVRKSENHIMGFIVAICITLVVYAVGYVRLIRLEKRLPKGLSENEQKNNSSGKTSSRGSSQFSPIHVTIQEVNNEFDAGSNNR
jgi:hypothetical protein